jgi:ActR/RegA family two-component response regulator
MIPSYFTDAITLFSGKVKLLILDDDISLCKSLSGIFVSPLFNISTATDLDQAFTAIGKPSNQWHCWIVDVDLGNGQNGLEIFKQRPKFPFAIVLSGLRSMGIASDAMKLGARIVLDKNPDSFDKLYDEVCKNGALGFVLGGKSTPQINTFLHLQEAAITTVDEWASKACVPVRHLQRICQLHQSLTPRYALALYRTIYFLLWNIQGADAKNANKPLSAGFGPDPSQRELYESSIAYIMRKTGN